MEVLERPIVRRRRRWAALAIALAVPAHLAALYALLARPDRVAYTTHVATSHATNVVHLPAPPVVVTAPPAPIVDTRACPAPNKRADRTIKPPAFDDAVTHVYASPTDADWIVAWNESVIYHSTDAGQSFSEVLAGSERVHSVAIDCFGRVIAARGEKIGVRDGVTETWSDVPGISLADRIYEGGYAPDPPSVWIVGGGPDVVVVGIGPPADEWKSRAAISRDLGRTWSYHDLSSGDFQGTHIATRQHTDGAIDLELEIQDCGGEWMETYTITNGIVSKVEDPTAPDDVDEKVWRAKIVKREPWRDTDVSTDAAGRRWAVSCGELVVVKKTDIPSCAEEAGNE